VPFLFWVHAQRDLFLNEIRSFIEGKLSRSLGLEVSFSGFRAGLFQGIVLERLSFHHPQSPFLLSVREVKIRGNRKRLALTFEKGEAVWKGIHFRNLKGQLFLTPDDFERLGPSVLLEHVILEGSLAHLRRAKISLQRENPLVFKGSFSLRDVQWGEKRLSGTGEMVFLIRDGRHPWQDAKVKINTQRLLLEDRPLENVSGHFSLVRKRLLVEQLRWGKLLSLSGEASLVSPYTTEAQIRILHFGDEALRHFFRNPEDKRIPRSVEGQIFVNGPLKTVHLRGHLVAHEGMVKEAPYQSMVNTFQGNWPVVTVESRIEREYPKESYAAVRGIVDLRALGQKGFYKTTALEGADAVVWKGLTLQNPSEETLVFGKNSPTTSVSLKTFLESGQTGGEPTQEFELEYRLQKEKSLKLRLKGEEEFLGLERKLSF